MDGFGFNIIGPSRFEQGRGIYISLVRPGGSAGDDGRLQAGDRIVAANGVSLESSSQEEAAKVFAAATSTLTLDVVSDLEGELSAGCVVVVV